MDENYLCHYGVKGMKWGIKHNPEKAFTKANAKYEKYQVKINKLKTKSDKATAKKYKRANPLIRTEISDARYRNASRKADKATAKYLKAKRKAEKWVEAMDKTFENYDVKALSLNKVNSGKNSLNKWLKNQAANL